MNSAILVLTTSTSVYLCQCNDNFVFIAVWVDNIFLVGSPSSLSATKAEIASEFNTTDQGDPQLLLGIKINCNHNTSKIKISQGQFLWKILPHFSIRGIHIGAKWTKSGRKLIKKCGKSLDETGLKCASFSHSFRFSFAVDASTHQLQNCHLSKLSTQGFLLFILFFVAQITWPNIPVFTAVFKSSFALVSHNVNAPIVTGMD